MKCQELNMEYLHINRNGTHKQLEMYLVLINTPLFLGLRTLLQMSSCVTGMAPLLEIQRSER